MWKNLNPAALGVSGRQSELLELALTYGFRGIDLDLVEIVKRARARGKEVACRCVTSAGIRVGEFALPMNCQAPETAYRSALVELAEVAEIASALGNPCCVMTVSPTNPDVPYHEFFELHRRRLGEIADVLSRHDLKLGLAFRAAPAHRPSHQAPFIHQAETLLTLIKTIGHPHVGLALDSWNWYVGGGAMDQLREIPCDQIVRVHLADIPSSVDLGRIADQDRYLPADGGLIDCGAIVRHLAEQQYSGPVSLCPHPARFTGMTRDAIVQRVSATYDALQRAAELTPGADPEPAPAMESAS
jgi:sugar phosphate isomerase/epimerase